MDIDKLRDRRSGAVQVSLKILTAGRGQMNADPLRSVNALTALVRTHDVRLDARPALTSAQIVVVSAWRHRDETLDLTSARREAVRLAKRILDLDADLKTNRSQVTALVEEHAPELLAAPAPAPRPSFLPRGPTPTVTVS
jgi:hypothetical protein